ncbi:MAG: hypothetical protein ISR65_18485 [Bacteriovoracaceae bacterium]|nr:hypothetical protein [candidate division KSB1 bacterium]MBL6991776.1 hypothetical protein [Bacteriovoracaceae bacterium]
MANVKLATPKTKYGLLRMAILAKGSWTRDQLANYTDFDYKNLSVSLSILKNRENSVYSYHRGSETYYFGPDLAIGEGNGRCFNTMTIPPQNG